MAALIPVIEDRYELVGSRIDFDGARDALAVARIVARERLRAGQELAARAPDRALARAVSEYWGRCLEDIDRAERFLEGATPQGDFR